MNELRSDLQGKLTGSAQTHLTDARIADLSDIALLRIVQLADDYTADTVAVVERELESRATPSRGVGGEECPHCDIPEHNHATR